MRFSPSCVTSALWKAGALRACSGSARDGFSAATAGGRDGGGPSAVPSAAVRVCSREPHSAACFSDSYIRLVYASLSRRGVVTAEQRRVCFDTLPLFESLHSRRHTTPPHEWWRAVQDFSRSVGAVLGRSDEVPTLQAVAAPPPLQPGEDRAALNRAVWELLDTCFVDQAQADGSTADALAAWLRRNHGAVLSDVPTTGSLAAVLSRVVPACARAPRPEEVPEYWPALGLLTACGWTRCAQELLHQHSAWADWRLRKPAAKPLVAVLEALERLVMHAPHGEALGAHSHAQAWRTAVHSTLASPSLWADVEGSATGQGARQVVAIMAGDQDVVMEACEQATWVELFVALLCRVHSSASTPRDLVRLAAACMGRKQVLARGPTVLDELLVAALARDAPEVVRLCASGLDAWMSAHVPDVLSASPDAYELVHTPVASATHGAITLSSWYRLQYAASCAATPALLHVACEYYAAAGPQGAKALHALLCGVSDEGDPDMQMRAYALARQLGSGTTASHVCAAAGATAEATGALGEAIQWYICGDLPDRLAALVDRILQPHPWGAPDPSVVASCLDSAFHVQFAACPCHSSHTPCTPQALDPWATTRPALSRSCRTGRPCTRPWMPHGAHPASRPASTRRLRFGLCVCCSQQTTSPVSAGLRPCSQRCLSSRVLAVWWAQRTQPS